MSKTQGGAVSGHRPFVLLLPGTLCNRRLWQAQADALQGQADVCIADLTGRDTIGAMAQDALDGVPAGPFAMAGFSLGGYVALEVMRRASARVSALALINTSARPEDAGGRSAREKMMALARTDFARLVSMLMQFMLAPAALADPSQVEAVRTMMHEVGPDAFIRQSLAVMDRADSRGTAAAVRCPTCIIAGADDRVAPPSMSTEMAQAIPSAQLFVLQGTGHMAPIEQATQVSVLLQRWLAQAGLGTAERA